MKSKLHFRLATEVDIDALSQLYAESVIALGPQRYSAAQVAAWSAAPRHTTRFRDFILKPRTFIAQDDAGAILGFAGLEPDGHVASLYVAAGRTRQGIGSQLLQRIIDDAKAHRITALHTEASEFSRPLFVRFGFTIANTEVVEYGNVQFTRYVMRLEVMESEVGTTDGHR